MSRVARVLLDCVVVGLVFWQAYDVGLAMWTRVGANFDLEWMEGATLITGLRAQEGLPFYTRPTADYIPFIYPPLYAWVLAAFSHVFPLGYALGRSISIACTVGALGVLVAAVRREGARWPLALAAGALFLGCYEEGGTFYDLVRIDALALFLTGLSLLFGRTASTRFAVASGLLLALAFTAKHNMASFGLPILIWRWRTFGRRDALVFAAASIGPAIAFVSAMEIYSNGLFLTYLLGVPSRHGSVWTRGLPNLKGGKVDGAQAEIVRALPYLVVAGLLTIHRWVRTPGGAYWGGHLLVGLVVASVMRAHQGGYLNVLIPMFWLLPVLVALVEPAVSGMVANSRARVLAPWVPALVSALIAAQIWEGKADLRRFLPTERDARAAAALVAELRDLEGPVLMPHGPWYPVLAGHAPSVALIALWDVDHEGGPLEKAGRSVDKAIRSHHYATIVSADDKLGHGLKEAYAKERSLKAPTFSTRTGWPIKFGAIWLPKATNAPQAPEGANNEAAAPDPEPPAE